MRIIPSFCRGMTYEFPEALYLSNGYKFELSKYWHDPKVLEQNANPLRRLKGLLQTDVAIDAEKFFP